VRSNSKMEDQKGEVVRAVAPLGLFGVVTGEHEFARLRDELRALVGALPKDERSSIAAYLRSGAITAAIMEYTHDMLNGAFGVSGGSAVLTDGTYYWRYDTADYVEHYGIGLPEEFLRHGRSLGWVARPLSQEDILALDAYIYKHGRRLPAK